MKYQMILWTNIPANFHHYIPGHNFLDSTLLVTLAICKKSLTKHCPKKHPDLSQLFACLGMAAGHRSGAWVCKKVTSISRVLKKHPDWT